MQCEDATYAIVDEFVAGCQVLRGLRVPTDASKSSGEGNTGLENQMR